MSEWDGTMWAGTPAKAATGIGVGYFNGARPLLSRERSPQELMKRAQRAYHSNPWIGTAEAVVTRKVVGLPWHLEDGQDQEYPDDAPQQDIRDARQLIERPQMALEVGRPGTATRRLMTALTSRHLGLCGMAYWYGDQLDIRGIPKAWLYVNPARMWPAEDAMGNLTGWVLDAQDDYGHGGTPLSLEEVLPFYLDPPDWGNLGSGLYERAMLKAQLSGLADQHAAYVLGTGGRIAGIVAPKEGTIPDEAFKALVAEFRNVNEAPDAAKRTTILQGPVDFTPTAADPSELNLVELVKLNRDDIFTIWGVPGSQAPVAMAAGLNSGDTKGYDEAILMQGAVHDRVVAIRETLQFGWLDKYAPTIIELIIEEPEYDDDTPAYERLSKATSAPLTNAQRWDIIGIPPTGDPAIDNAILLPNGVGLWATAPAEGETTGVIVEPVAPVAPVPFQPVPMEPPVKAREQRAFLGLRSGIEAKYVPATKTKVAATLAAQRSHVVSWLRAHETHLTAKPKDGAWWNASKEDARLAEALLPETEAIAQTVTKRAKDVLGHKADFESAVESRVARETGVRIVGINEKTRERVASAIAEGFAEGLSVAEIADVIEGLTWFDELRAETIARTEMMFAYNSAAIDSYREYGVERVVAIDGDGDAECADRNGRDYSLDEAMTIEDHPNGTLDWAPYFEKQAAASIETPFDLTALIAALAATKAEPVTIHMPAPEPVPLMRTVLDRDYETGRVIGYHQEVFDGVSKAVTDLRYALADIPAPQVTIEPTIVNVAPAAVTVTPPDVYVTGPTISPPAVTVKAVMPAHMTMDILSQPTIRKTVTRRDKAGRVDETVEKVDE